MTAALDPYRKRRYGPQHGVYAAHETNAGEAVGEAAGAPGHEATGVRRVRRFFQKAGLDELRDAGATVEDPDQPSGSAVRHPSAIK